MKEFWELVPVFPSDIKRPVEEPIEGSRRPERGEEEQVDEVEEAGEEREVEDTLGLINFSPKSDSRE